MKRSKYDNGDNLAEDNPMDELSYIEMNADFAARCKQIDRQLKEIEGLYTMVSSLRYELDAAVRKMNKALPAFGAAVDSATNITDGIIRAIVKAENTPIKVALGEDDLKLLAAHRKELIDMERKLIQSAHAEHLNTIRRTLQRAPAIYLSGTLATFITWLFWISLIFALGMILAIVIVLIVGK